MKRIRLHRYTKTLLAAYGLVAFGLLITCMLAYNQLQDISETTEKLHIHPFAVSNAALEAKDALASIREHILYATLTRDKNTAQAAIAEISRLDVVFSRNLDIISKFYLGDTNAPIHVEQLFKKWRIVRDTILETIRAGDFEIARGLILTAGTPAFEEIRSTLDTIIEFAKYKAQFFIVQSRQQTQQTQRTLFLIIFLGFAASIACGYFMIRNVQRLIFQREEVLCHKANHDPLTGLANRALLLDRLATDIALAMRTNSRVGVIFIDLDGFKNVNDTLGHEAGDELLVLTARRLAAALRGEDTIARLGGDEFVVVIPGVNDSRAVARVFEKVAGALNVCTSIKDATLRVTASMGMAVYPEDGSTPDDLLASADAAMYKAKTRSHSGSTATTRPVS